MNRSDDYKDNTERVGKNGTTVKKRVCDKQRDEEENEKMKNKES